MKRNTSFEKGIARPFVKWAGGKGKLLDVLKDNLPQEIGTAIKKYAEPFVGGGALLFALLNEYSFEEVYVNDKNKELINVYLTLKNNCGPLIDKLKTIQEEYKSIDSERQKAYYYEKRKLFNALELNKTNTLLKAALFIFLNKTCFNGLYRVNSAGKFNVPVGRYKNPLICDEENLQNVSKRLQNIIIRGCDYHDVEFFVDDKTFVYLDPPYRPLTVTSGFTSYNEMQFDDNDQIEIAKFYKKLSDKGVKILLSNSDPHNANPEDDFFDELYAEFSVQRIIAMRTINSKAEKRGKISELLIKNY